MTWAPLSLGQARRQQHFPICFGWGSGWARDTQSEAVWNSRHHLPPVHACCCQGRCSPGGRWDCGRHPPWPSYGYADVAPYKNTPIWHREPMVACEWYHCPRALAKPQSFTEPLPVMLVPQPVQFCEAAGGDCRGVVFRPAEPLSVLGTACLPGPPARPIQLLTCLL